MMVRLLDIIACAQILLKLAVNTNWSLYRYINTFMVLQLCNFIII